MEAKAGDIQNKELLQQGAEAKIFRILWKGDKTAILKERVAKAYRHPDLDRKISKERILLEVKNLQGAGKLGITVPEVYNTNIKDKCIVMEFVEGTKLRDWFKQNSAHPQLVHQQLKKMGTVIDKLHNNQIIHGDLTTSNMIARGEELVLIDFGLSYVKNNVEDKAVDLYVLERAFVSTHPELQEAFKGFYEGYTNQEVINRLEKGKIYNKTIMKSFPVYCYIVRQRGRKKVAFG